MSHHPRTSHLERDHCPPPHPLYRQEHKVPRAQGFGSGVPWGGKEKQGLELRPPDSSALEYFHFTLNEDILETLIFSSWYSGKTRHHHSVPLEKTQRPQLLLTRYTQTPGRTHTQDMRRERGWTGMGGCNWLPEDPRICIPLFPESFTPSCIRLSLCPCSTCSTKTRHWRRVRGTSPYSAGGTD